MPRYVAIVAAASQKHDTTLRRFGLPSIRRMSDQISEYLSSLTIMIKLGYGSAQRNHSYAVARLRSNASFGTGNGRHGCLHEAGGGSDQGFGKGSVSNGQRSGTGRCSRTRADT